MENDKTSQMITEILTVTRMICSLPYYRTLTVENRKDNLQKNLESSEHTHVLNSKLKLKTKR